MKKRITIIGGSIAGLSAALVLASAKNDELDFDINIIDSGKPDLNAGQCIMHHYSLKAL